MGKRGRKKTNKEYAIRLVHPELGEFYFSYIKYSDSYRSYNDIISFMFTKDLSKVKKWKTLDIVKNEVMNMPDIIRKSSANSVLLKIDDSVKTGKVIISRKKYYYSITNIGSEIYINKFKEKIENINKIIFDLKKSIKEEKINYNNIKLEIKTKIENDQDIDNIIKGHHVFLEKLNIIKKDINNCKKYQIELNKLNIHLNDIENGIKIDIVDASFNFRLKKLKMLNTFQEEVN